LQCIILITKFKLLTLINQLNNTIRIIILLYIDIVFQSNFMSFSTSKIYYIDRLKVLLTILVVMHHASVTYGAPGGWYYAEKTTLMGALIPMTLFVSINQAYFMGFFFFLSAFFIPASFQKKGAGVFIKDRLKRLGIPLLFYSFVLSPLLGYLVNYFAKGHTVSYLQYLQGFDHWIDFGVLWFVAALLLFTLFHVLMQIWIKYIPITGIRVPGPGRILLFAIGIGIISYLVRIYFPVGWVLHPLGFQLGHFTQYIALFILGLLAASNNWLKLIPLQTGKRMALIVFLLFLFFPVFYIIRVKLDIPISWYSGGFHWQSLLYAVWEQAIGFSIITALLCYGREYLNHTTVFISHLSRAAFAVYIFHPLVLISLSLLLRNYSLDPSIKLLIVAPAGVVGSFLLASLIVRIPGVRNIV